MYRITDLQACEPETLTKAEGIVVTFGEKDTMGFDRVTVYSGASDELVAYVRENWGDDDQKWFAEYVTDRVELISEAPIYRTADGTLHEIVLTDEGDPKCPCCGHNDCAGWADDGEADLADWWRCEKFSGGCGATGAVVDAFDPTHTQNGCEVPQAS